MSRTLSDVQVRRIAADHEEARRTITPIRRVTRTFPEMTIDDAYACQQAWVDQQLAAGANLIGHKIGLTSRAMQLAMKIDEPDFGALLDHMVIADGSTLERAAYLDPKVEVELAFVLATPVRGPEVSVDDVVAATDHVIPALELIDARSYRVDPDDGTSRTVVDTISDNAADAGILCGGRPIDPRCVDLRWVGAILARNGVVEETGLAAGVLGHPARGVAWLARRLHRYGLGLEAGEVVLAGSFTRPLDCRPGDELLADFGPHGTLALTFS